MKKIYIASHGEMAEGMKDSLKLIAGEMSNQIKTFTLKPGGSAEDFISEVEREVVKSPEEQIIIMGDLFGASIVNSMFRLINYSNVILLSGVNLSMALQILLDNSNQISDETIDFIIEESKKGILRLKNVEEELSEEF